MDKRVKPGSSGAHFSSFAVSLSDFFLLDTFFITEMIGLTGYRNSEQSGRRKFEAPISSDFLEFLPALKNRNGMIRIKEFD